MKAETDNQPGESGQPAASSKHRHLTTPAAIVVGLLVILAIVTLHPVIRRAVSAPPNILVISLCSVRADHLGCYGYPRSTSPNLDQLATEGILFEHAVTPWPKTAPAFAALMTGKYGHTTGVMRITPDQFLGDDHETLAEILAKRGYATAVFNSTPVLNPATNLLQGFEHVVQTYRNETPFADATRQAAEWLSQPHERPFLAWIHYNNAHHPYLAPGVERDMFVGDEHYQHEPLIQAMPKATLNLPVADNHPFRRQILHPDLGGAHPSVAIGEEPVELGLYVARYDAGIASADKMIGRLLTVVRENGLLDDTIVVVVSDHGESMGKMSYYFGHGRFPYDDCARVPLIIRPPGQPAPRRIAPPMSTLSLAPTLLQLANIEPPEAMEAPSLVPMMEGGQGVRYVFAESGYQIDYTLSVRDDTWKLIYIPDKLDQSLLHGVEYELYNLREDRGETRNLYESLPNESARLRNVLHTWAEPWIDYAYGKQPQKPPVVDDETLQRLRALGYVD